MRLQSKICDWVQLLCHYSEQSFVEARYAKYAEQQQRKLCRMPIPPTIICTSSTRLAPQPKPPETDKYVWGTTQKPENTWTLQSLCCTCSRSAVEPGSCPWPLSSLEHPKIQMNVTMITTKQVQDIFSSLTAVLLSQRNTP